MKTFKNLRNDLGIVFAPISAGERTRVLLLASIVTLLELVGFVLIAAAIASIEGEVPSIIPSFFAIEDSPVTVTAVAFILFIVRGLVTGFYQWWVLGIINEGERAATISYVCIFLALPFEEQTQTASSDVLRTVRVSIGRSYQMFAVGAVELVAEIPAMSALLVVLFIVAPTAALAVLVMLAVALLGFHRFAGRRLVELGRENERFNTFDFQVLLQILNGARELLVRQVEGVYLTRLSDNRERLVRVQKGMTFLKASARLYLEVLLVVGLGVVLLIASLANSGAIALSVVAVFAVAGFRALPSAARILLGLANVQSGRAPLEEAAAKLRDVGTGEHGLDLVSEVRRRVSDAPTPARVELENIWFQYPKQAEPVLRGVNLKVDPGMSIALVGRSGAGKTTLVDVMLGLLVPSRGTILIDGKPLEASSLKAWRSRVALVPQDVFLLDATVADNVRFGFVDDGSNPTVKQCLLDSQLWADVELLPDGVETRLGPSGIRFSGGQRQRLGIARALYLRPDVIFLDEATSALDTVTEMALSETLENLRGKVTSVTVAHRLSTVRGCDQTAYVEAGRIIDIGTYDELSSRCEPFQRMISAAESRGGLFQDGASNG